MKTQTPFLPLLKNELALGRFGDVGVLSGTLLIYWLAIGALPLLVLFHDSNAQGNIAALFDAGFLPILASLLLGALTLWMTYATVPAFCQLLAPGGSIPGAIQHAGAFEFMFTRAVDRRILFRARSTAFLILALTPFFLNVLMSPFAPPVSLSPPNSAQPLALHQSQLAHLRSLVPSDSTSGEELRRYEQYLHAFPSSHPGLGLETNIPWQASQLIIPHGALAFTAWMTWSATLAFLLLQAYGTLVARWVKPNNWWTALYPAAPIVFLIVAFGIQVRGSIKSRFASYEESFLFFSTHPLAMVIALIALALVLQVWCERRFSKLEIL